MSVLPQLVGTLNYIYSTYEATDDLDEGVILVLDPGFFSVDWVVFRRKDIVRDSGDSSMEAMSSTARRHQPGYPPRIRRSWAWPKQDRNCAAAWQALHPAVRQQS